MREVASYGSWKSLVTPEYVSGQDRILGPHLQPDGENIYFVELRPDEGGRIVLKCLLPDGSVQDVLPTEFNVRTRYLEYGGLSFLVNKGICYFVNFSDQEIYVAESGHAPKKLTNQKDNRFADFAIDEKRNRLIALREVLTHPESKNSICAIDLASGQVEDLITGSDFYICPRIKGDEILWISWNHPNMPWNGTELWRAKITDLHSRQKIAGDQNHAVAQASWGPHDEIYFTAELSNFINLYRVQDGRAENLIKLDAEFSSPDWNPGNKQYAVSKSGTICAAYLVEGRWKIIQRNQDASVKTLNSSFANFSSVHPHRDFFVAIIGHATRPASLVSIDLNGELKDLYSPQANKLSADYISVGEELKYPIEASGVGYAWYYPPKNPTYRAPDGEKPPLIVCAHGGPTSMSPSIFRKEFQFWTSRGYALVDVNYGGSTGFGRNYRERLRNNWGIVDVGDCVSAVKSLASKNLIDPQRVAIRGGSAGGYTTLAALTFTQNIFAAGASYYGVSNLELLAKETHKFESRYLDQLVGPYPEAQSIYKERAPIEHINQLSCPIIFFQGDEDKIVPPNQSELMHEALKKKNIPTEYHLYAKEGHGFRRAESNQNSLKCEHNFYARFFGFKTWPEDQV